MRKKLFWWGLFTVLFLLSLDYWSWDNTVELSWLGLPAWVFYFVVLQLVLVLAIYLFARFYWKE